MTSARLAAASVLALFLAPALARADSVCDRLTGAVAMAANGFDIAEGDPIASDSGQYWRSKIQFSDGDNCAIEAHRLLTCSWEPSTEADLKKMVDTVSTCFPNVHPDVVKSDDDDGPPGASFKFDQTSIEIGLTADVLSVNIGPKTTPEVTPQPEPAPATPDAAPPSPEAAPHSSPDPGPTPETAAPPEPAPTPPDAASPPAPDTPPQPKPDSGPTPPPAPSTPEAAPQPESAPAVPDAATPSPPDATPPPAPDPGPTPAPTPNP